MKSYVASSCTWRTRSLRKIAAPLRTPTNSAGSCLKSEVICCASSPTRWAIWSREMSSLSSSTDEHLTLSTAGVRAIPVHWPRTGQHLTTWDRNRADKLECSSHRREAENAAEWTQNYLAWARHFSHSNP